MNKASDSEREVQVPSAPASFACCERCTASGDKAGTLAAEPAPAGAIAPASPSMVARRRLLKAAVLRRGPGVGGTARLRAEAGAVNRSESIAAEAAAALPTAEAATSPTAEAATSNPPGDSGQADDDAAEFAGFADSAQLPRTVCGTVIDVGPHVLVVGDADYEQRFMLTPDAVAWRGGLLEPAALRQGDSVVVRLHRGHRDVADRIWANIGRVTGVIAERVGDELVIDEGATREPQHVILHRQAAGRIQVRFPTLEPGFLVDIIGRRDGDELVGLIPATSQPSYPAGQMPAAPLISGRPPRAITGSATWHEPRNEAPGVLGVSYPALDPETGCAEDAVTGARQSYGRMPYLAMGSVLRVKNDCTGSDCLVPITGCAPIARLFNDRCVTCGTSPRGRIADLTMATFIALGGELERGCFNATLSLGE